MSFNKNTSGNRFKREKSFGRKKSSFDFQDSSGNKSFKKSFGNNNPFGNRESSKDGDERSFKDGFKSRNLFSSRGSFGGKKTFGGNGKPFNSNRPFREKEERDSQGNKKFFGRKKFNDNIETSNNRSFRGGKFKGNASWGKNSSRIPKDIPTLPNKNGVSLEYVLDYFQQHETTNLLALQNNAEMFLSKINLLLKNDVVKQIDEDTFKLNLDEASQGISEFSYLKIKSSLIGNHYFVQISSLNKKPHGEEEVIIENLKENLKDRIILAKITVQEEKIIATPLFYLREINNPQPQIQSNDLLRGVYQIYDNTDFLIPLNYKSRNNLYLLNVPKNLNAGAIVEAVLDGNDEATFSRIIAQDNSATSVSMLSVYQYNLRNEFSAEIKSLAKSFEAVDPANRRDIRDIPLVTIDDDDAKDFDDAIFAKKIEGRENTYKIYVAIADVSWYVKPNDALDMEAQLRGNSVYLPGLTIPMLPKELSNGWCSLNPNEDRGCLVMEGIINHNGELESFEFYRGLMKSHARLTYTKVANALDGEVSEDLQPLMENVIHPLREAFYLLDSARKKRNAIELESPEAKFILDKNNNILDVKLRESLISHKIVEEFMIAANVATAKLITRAGLNLSGLAIYRVHAKPSPEKIMAFTNTLKSFGLMVKPPVNIKSSFFNDLLHEFSDKPFFNALNEAVLRSQSQAEYANENIGHFGLALKEYCHFTSPIRRYSDLMIHRLVLSIINKETFQYSSALVANIAKSISMSERLAFNAERSADNRAFAKWLSSQIGESFMSEVSTITNAGMFVNLVDIGASGLIPMRTISRGFAQVDLKKNMIIDRHSGRTFNLGDKIPIIIKEADSMRGLLTFIIDEDNMVKKPKRRR
ncbi:MAG: VacB/RNase II family 3'-5' exoribonuclease [Alphaproteobacteria bacterium]|nr:VacB/RNase II family 3'-5' exoribonuclease [Alphaproteobacteria bacterium]